MALRENWVDGVDVITAAELNAIGVDVNGKAYKTYTDGKLAEKAPLDAGTPSSAINPVLPRRGSSTEWAGQNPILANGEIGYETDTKLHKRGDGASVWNALPHRDEIMWYDNSSVFPSTGSVGVLYGSRSGGQLYLWVSGEYIAIARKLIAAAALGFGSIPTQSFADLTISIIGAVVGDSVALGVPAATAATAGVAFTSWVSASDVVTVRAHNYSAIAVTPASGGIFKVTVIR